MRPTTCSRSELEASQRRQKFLDFLAGKLATSTPSKVPEEFSHLLPAEDRHLAGERARRKSRSDARRKMLPVFLRKPLKKWREILKWKLLGPSLRLCSFIFWRVQRTAWRIRVLKFSRENSRRSTRAAWPTKPGSPKKRRPILARWRSASGENISGTNTSFRTKESRARTSCNTCSAISKR